MRLSKADPAIVTAYLRRRWFEVAPKKLHAAFEQERTPAKSTKRPTRKASSKPRRQVRQPRR
jgi:hypothetical protein